MLLISASILKALRTANANSRSGSSSNKYSDPKFQKVKRKIWESEEACTEKSKADGKNFEMKSRKQIFIEIWISMKSLN